MSNPTQAQTISKEAQDRMALAGAQAAAPSPVVTAAASIAAEARGVPPVDPAQLEETIRKIIAEAQQNKNAAQAEPDWSKVTEAVALDVDAPMYIPVIEHEIPSYLDVRLADPEYLPVWVNKNVVRISAKKAEGYELLKKEHVAKDFQVPLAFDSEGLYSYADVICMRVHKRILLGRRRRLVELSTGQLRGMQAHERAKSKLESDVISRDPALDTAFNKGSMSFF